jgi:hypothetical protein
MAQLYSLSKCGCFLSFAISFCTFHDFDFLWRQAVERIHQLVQLPLQRARVRLGIPLLRREDAVNQFDDWFCASGSSIARFGITTHRLLPGSFVMNVRSVDIAVVLFPYPCRVKGVASRGRHA